MTGISAIILAGGESRRMGSNKALLSLDGQPLIARTAACLRPLADELIVVTNTPEAYQFLVADFAARLIPDALPARSALVGLYSGLRMARGDLALAVACDMPFLNPALLGERYGADNGRIARIILSSTVLAFVSFTLLAWGFGAAAGV